MMRSTAVHRVVLSFLRDLPVAVGAAGLALCSASFGQAAPPAQTPPPPPTMEVPPPVAPTAATPPKADAPAKGDKATLGSPGRAEENIGPQVTIRQDGDNKIEEYRLNGRMYAIRVTPPHGKPYTMVDNDGSGNFVQSAEIGGGAPRPARWLVFEF